MTSHSINTVGPDVGVCEQRRVGPGEEECVRPDGVRWFWHSPGMASCHPVPGVMGGGIR